MWKPESIDSIDIPVWKDAVAHAWKDVDQKTKVKQIKKTISTPLHKRKAKSSSDTPESKLELPVDRELPFMAGGVRI